MWLFSVIKAEGENFGCGSSTGILGTTGHHRQVPHFLLKGETQMVHGWLEMGPHREWISWGQQGRENTTSQQVTVAGRGARTALRSR